MANAFKSYGQSAIGTSNTTVYTAPSSTTTTVIGLVVANIAAADITVDVTLTKSATTYYLGKDIPVPVGSSVVVVGGAQKLVLETTDAIKVKSSASTSADAVVSVLEITA